MRVIITLIITAVFAGLMGCSTGKTHVEADAIFEDDFTVFHEDGSRSRLVADPLFEEDYLFFHEDGNRDDLIADPLFEGDFILFRGERHGQEKEGF